MYYNTVNKITIYKYILIYISENENVFYMEYQLINKLLKTNGY